MTNIEELKKSGVKVNAPINIFRKSAFTAEEKKMPIKYDYDNFTFFCMHADLTAPLEVFPSHDYNTPYMASNWMEAFCRDYACFLFSYSRDVWPHLCGFCGFDCVDFEFDEKVKIDFNVKDK